MGLFDKLFNNPVQRPVGEDLEKVFTRVNPHRLSDDLFNFSMHTRKIGQLNQTSFGRAKLKHLYTEPSIHQVTNTRLDGLSSINLQIVSENEQVAQFIQDQIMPFQHLLIRNSVWAVFLGFSIFEIVWEERGGQNVIKDIIFRDNERFDPLIDGLHVTFQEHGVHTTEPEPFGKYLAAINEGCAENPWGDSLYQTLHYITKARNFGLRSWAKWLERFGNPFLYGKTCASEQAVEQMMNLLDGAMDASSIVTDHESDVKILEADGSNGQQFKVFDDCMRKQIHMAVLGQNLTTEVNQGSMAAANVHEGVRQDKVNADARLVQQTVQKLITFIKFWNNIPEELGVRVEIVHKKGIDRDRAERDAILVNAGILRFTEEYIEDRYDLRIGEFEVGRAPGPLSLKKNDSKFDFQLSEQQEEVDDIVNLLAGRGANEEDVNNLYASILASDNRSQLISQLAELADDSNQGFEELLTRAAYFALGQGAKKVD